jgi:hypothetical protein
MAGAESLDADCRQGGLLASRDVQAALAVLRAREGERARLEPADLLALTYVEFHLVHRIAPPVAWAVEAANSVRLRYQVGGGHAEAVISFLLDYASARFRQGDLAHHKMPRYFDWYLATKETVASRCGRPVAGYKATEPTADKLIRDTRRFYAACHGGQAREQALRRAWDKAVREIERWRSG